MGSAGVFGITHSMVPYSECSNGMRHLKYASVISVAIQACILDTRRLLQQGQINNEMQSMTQVLHDLIQEPRNLVSILYVRVTQGFDHQQHCAR